MMMTMMVIIIITKLGLLFVTTSLERSKDCQLGSHDALLLLRSSFSAPKVLYLLRCSPSIAHSHRRRKGSVVGVHYGECGARAYNGGLGAEPPAGSRGRAPGQGVRGPLKLKAFWSLAVQRSRQI